MTPHFGDEQKHLALHSFCYRPGVRFEEQQEGEEVLLVLRAHPITQLHWIVIAIVLSVIPLVGNIILVQFLTFFQVLFLNLFWYSFVFSYVFLNTLSWVFNVGIVTNMRVLDIDYNLILNKEITGAPLDDITDLTIQSKGFIPSLFDFGDVHIQTPGAKQNIEFYSVPHPASVVTIINRLMGKEK